MYSLHNKLYSAVYWLFILWIWLMHGRWNILRVVMNLQVP